MNTMSQDPETEAWEIRTASPAEAHLDPAWLGCLFILDPDESQIVIKRHLTETHLCTSVRYLVTRRRIDGPEGALWWLAIIRRDGRTNTITRNEIRAIRNALLGPGAHALELYPSEPGLKQALTTERHVIAYARSIPNAV